jgi:hypothetical protein
MSYLGPRAWYKCDACQQESEGFMRRLPPGWITTRFFPGALVNTQHRPDLHRCPACVKDSVTVDWGPPPDYKPVVVSREKEVTLESGECNLTIQEWWTAEAEAALAAEAEKPPLQHIR